ncbi:MAG: hypothetical protein NTV54_11255 [Ignavibacteriales bacterium]|nr:hypothetical protein [Ignavibacteriales bacterium]
MKIRLLLVAVCFVSICPRVLRAQSQLLPIDHQLNNRLSKTLYSLSHPVHSPLQPFELRDLTVGNNVDSVLATGRVWDTTNTGSLSRKLFAEHLVDIVADDYRLYIDFYPDFQIGRDVEAERTTSVNTRAFGVGGSAGNAFSFRADFYDNQVKFPEYVDAIVRRDSIIPGQGYYKYSGTQTFDFAYASAVISYRPSRYLGVQVGQGKNFLGDGYRSLMLSDAAFNYPYLKLTADLWKIKYICMWTEFQHITSAAEPDAWHKKSGVFHYLDVNITKRLSVGLFESMIWREQDSTGRRGIELNYLNPIIFLHPTGYSIGSPDNYLIGMNWRYIIADGTALYGQAMLDEFVIGELVKNRGWWGNKYGIQFGVKSAEPLNVRGLFAQAELNLVSPYTYAHLDPEKNHAHYRQSLEHPLGANFYEWLAIGQYSTGRYEFRLQCNYALYGNDSSATDNVGKDVYKSYVTRDHEYGNFIGQGIHTRLLYAQVQTSYLLNPMNNLRLEASCSYRSATSTIESSESLHVSFGIRGSFRNLYYDF